MINILDYIKKNPLVLAPMAGITDSAFRSFMKEMGASIVVTELISATGTQYQSARTLKLMDFTPDQYPVGIQLFGEDPAIMAHAAQVAESRGCNFIDLNFGCPVPKVVKKGGGSAILRDLKALETMIRTVKSAIQIPLTIKIRTGWDQNSRNASEVTHIAYNEGVSWVAIHGRTRAQGYSGEADWDFIREVKAQSPLPILGNGDLNTPQMVEKRLKESGCDGVMIGRGCLKNPFIFQETLARLKLNQESQRHSGEIIDAPQEHFQSTAPSTSPFSGTNFNTHKPSEINPPLVLSTDSATHFNSTTDSSLFTKNLWSAYGRLHTHLATQCDDVILTIQLKKFAAWYSTGYSGASQFRKSIFQTKEKNEVLDLTEEFFKALTFQSPEDTTQEPFLMGGHG